MGIDSLYSCKDDIQKYSIPGNMLKKYFFKIALNDFILNHCGFTVF